MFRTVAAGDVALCVDGRPRGQAHRRGRVPALGHPPCLRRRRAARAAGPPRAGGADRGPRGDRGGTLEVADIVQVGFGLQRTFSKHLSSTFNYRYQTRSSNLANASYDVNDISVTVNYTF